MLRKIIAALLAIPFAIALLVSTPQPAQAAWTDCPLGKICIWTGNDASGSRYEYSWATILNGTHAGIRLGSGISNRGYSFYNRLGSGRDIALHDSNNCNAGVWYRRLNNTQYATAQGSDWGGRVSSIQAYSAVNPGGPYLYC